MMQERDPDDDLTRSRAPHRRRPRRHGGGTNTVFGCGDAQSSNGGEIRKTRTARYAAFAGGGNSKLDGWLREEWRTLPPAATDLQIVQEVQQQPLPAQRISDAERSRERRACGRGLYIIADGTCSLILDPYALLYLQFFRTKILF